MNPTAPTFSPSSFFFSTNRQHGFEDSWNNVSRSQFTQTQIAHSQTPSVINKMIHHTNAQSPPPHQQHRMMGVRGNTTTDNSPGGTDSSDFSVGNFSSSRIAYSAPVYVNSYGSDATGSRGEGAGGAGGNGGGNGTALHPSVANIVMTEGSGMPLPGYPAAGKGEQQQPQQQTETWGIWNAPGVEGRRTAALGPHTNTSARRTPGRRANGTPDSHHHHGSRSPARESRLHSSQQSGNQMRSGNGKGPVGTLVRTPSPSVSSLGGEVSLSMPKEAPGTVHAERWKRQGKPSNLDYRVDGSGAEDSSSQLSQANAFQPSRKAFTMQEQEDLLGTAIIAERRGLTEFAGHQQHQQHQHHHQQHHQQHQQHHQQHHQQLKSDTFTSSAPEGRTASAAFEQSAENCVSVLGDQQINVFGSSASNNDAGRAFEGFRDKDGLPVGGSTPRLMLFCSDGSLRLDFFKVHPCKNESYVHDRKSCPFYHSQRDKRRWPVCYRAEQCDEQFDLEGDIGCICPKADSCDKCHNRHELLYHPEIYKQRFCSSYPHLECHRGKFCAFAHTRKEIKCQLFSEKEEKNPNSEFFMKRFKTLWCPYGVQHDWHGCLYAHTYQDCRRSPLIGYGSEPCPYWQKDLHSADYRKRCPLGPRCSYSHGSKEQLYHPAYYKSMPCADYKAKRTCPRGKLCAFYHEPSEKRNAAVTAELMGNETAVFGGFDGSHRFYDYNEPIASEAMSSLQSMFMRPPLFNLDDFEAFGHASRGLSRRRSSAVSAQRNLVQAQNSFAGLHPTPTQKANSSSNLSAVTQRSSTGNRSQQYLSVSPTNPAVGQGGPHPRTGASQPTLSGCMSPKQTVLSTLLGKKFEERHSMTPRAPLPDAPSQPLHSTGPPAAHSELDLPLVSLTKTLYEASLAQSRQSDAASGSRRHSTPVLSHLESTGDEKLLDTQGGHSGMPPKSARGDLGARLPDFSRDGLADAAAQQLSKINVEEFWKTIEGHKLVEALNVEGTLSPADLHDVRRIRQPAVQYPIGGEGAYNQTGQTTASTGVSLATTQTASPSNSLLCKPGSPGARDIDLTPSARSAFGDFGGGGSSNLVDPYNSNNNQRMGGSDHSFSGCARSSDAIEAENGILNLINALTSPAEQAPGKSNSLLGSAASSDSNLRGAATMPCLNRQQQDDLEKLLSALVDNAIANDQTPMSSVESPVAGGRRSALSSGANRETAAETAIFNGLLERQSHTKSVAFERQPTETLRPSATTESVPITATTATTVPPHRQPTTLARIPSITAYVKDTVDALRVLSRLFLGLQPPRQSSSVDASSVAPCECAANILMVVRSPLVFPHSPTQQPLSFPLHYYKLGVLSSQTRLDDFWTQRGCLWFVREDAYVELANALFVARPEDSTISMIVVDVVDTSVNLPVTESDKELIQVPSAMADLSSKKGLLPWLGSLTIRAAPGGMKDEVERLQWGSSSGVVNAKLTELPTWTLLLGSPADACALMGGDKVLESLELNESILYTCGAASIGAFFGLFHPQKSRSPAPAGKPLNTLSLTMHDLQSICDTRDTRAQAASIPTAVWDVLSNDRAQNVMLKSLSYCVCGCNSVSSLSRASFTGFTSPQAALNELYELFEKKASATAIGPRRRVLLDVATKPPTFEVPHVDAPRELSEPSRARSVPRQSSVSRATRPVLRNSAVPPVPTLTFPTFHQQDCGSSPPLMIGGGALLYPDELNTPFLSPRRSTPRLSPRETPYCLESERKSGHHSGVSKKSILLNAEASDSVLLLGAKTLAVTFPREFEGVFGLTGFQHLLRSQTDSPQSGSEGASLYAPSRNCDELTLSDLIGCTVVWRDSAQKELGSGGNKSYFFGVVVPASPQLKNRSLYANSESSRALVPVFIELDHQHGTLTNVKSRGAALPRQRRASGIDARSVGAGAGAGLLSLEARCFICKKPLSVPVGGLPCRRRQSDSDLFINETEACSIVEKVSKDRCCPHLFHPGCIRERSSTELSCPCERFLHNYVARSENAVGQRQEAREEPFENAHRPLVKMRSLTKFGLELALSLADSLCHLERLVLLAAMLCARLERARLPVCIERRSSQLLDERVYAWRCALLLASRLPSVLFGDLSTIRITKDAAKPRFDLGDLLETKSLREPKMHGAPTLQLPHVFGWVLARLCFTAALPWEFAASGDLAEAASYKDFARLQTVMAEQPLFYSWWEELTATKTLRIFPPPRKDVNSQANLYQGSNWDCVLIPRGGPVAYEPLSNLQLWVSRLMRCPRTAVCRQYGKNAPLFLSSDIKLLYAFSSTDDVDYYSQPPNDEIQAPWFSRVPTGLKLLYEQGVPRSVGSQSSSIFGGTTTSNNGLTRVLSFGVYLRNHWELLVRRAPESVLSELLQLLAKSGGVEIGVPAQRRLTAVLEGRDELLWSSLKQVCSKMEDAVLVGKARLG